MKQAKSLTAALFLSLLFASRVFAGDIYCGITGTTGNPAPATNTASVSAQEPTSADSEQEAEASPAAVLAEAALDVLRTVLAVF